MDDDFFVIDIDINVDEHKHFDLFVHFVFDKYFHFVLDEYLYFVFDKYFDFKFDFIELDFVLDKQFDFVFDKHFDLDFHVIFNIVFNIVFIFNDDNGVRRVAYLIAWRIYYDDGSVFSSRDGTWEEAPNDGIQIVVELYDDGERKLHLERDHYILDDGKIFGTNNINPWLRKHGLVKFGRWYSDEKFRDLVKKAKNDVFE